MEYYKAYEIDDKPFVTWNGVGVFNTPEDFEDSQWGDDPLVVSATDIVAQYGVYTKHIVGGALVAWTAPELLIFRDEYNINRAVIGESLRIGDVNKGTFTYDGNDFPMDEVSRLFYVAIENNAPSSSKIRTMENTAYDLDAADINAFMTAYYAALLLISKHTI